MRLGLLDIADSSLGNQTGGSSQVGFIICAVDKNVYKGEEVDISILVYKSHKMDRSGSSTLLTEANAMSEALAQAEWVASWFGLAQDLQYDLRQRDKLNREIKIVSLMKEPQELTHGAITDAKSLYDNMNREQYTKAEKRAASTKFNSD